MISDKMYMKLIDAGFNIKRPTFEELWSLLPCGIIFKGNISFLELTKPEVKENSLGYFFKNDTLTELYSTNNNKSLSDLAAEMLIELKQKGLLND